MKYKAVRAWHADSQIWIECVLRNAEDFSSELAASRTLSFPMARNPLLQRATKEQLNNIEISPFGLHWPDLDEDLSLSGILEGRVAGPTKR